MVFWPYPTNPATPLARFSATWVIPPNFPWRFRFTRQFKTVLPRNKAEKKKRQRPYWKWRFYFIAFLNSPLDIHQGYVFDFLISTLVGLQSNIKLCKIFSRPAAKQNLHLGNTIIVKLKGVKFGRFVVWTRTWAPPQPFLSRFEPPNMTTYWTIPFLKRYFYAGDTWF